MNDDIKRLHNLIDTYKLSRPVSPELQQYVINNRGPDLRRILMKSGKYSLISWFVIMIFSLLRKYGLHVTMIQSKIIAGITAAAVASGSAAAAYRGARYVNKVITRAASQVEETNERHEPEAGEDIENTSPVAPLEQKGAEEKRSVPVYKEKNDPAEKNLPGKEQQEKVKEKEEPEGTINDIPSL
jgi:hypothetical protein